MTAVMHPPHNASILLLAIFAMNAFAESAPLSREEAKTQLELIKSEIVEKLKKDRSAELESKQIDLAGKSLRWEERVFGESPAGGRSLWISMHGGGGAPPAVNDQQWRNQVGLYEPAEGIYVAPRGPTDNWNLWHEPHVDPMFDRLIEDYVAIRGVDPNRVYLMGYSAGGDGVWQLGPRMADRFAAAAMMAGHPNDASLLPLRNLPFAIFVGANDAAYKRNEVVAEKAAELDRLEVENPGCYVHMTRIYPNTGHWMNRRDAEALPWMAKYSRNPWPKKVAWIQDDVTHPDFYWLAIPAATAKAKQKIEAEVNGQTIRIKGDVPEGLSVRLSDEILDLDQTLNIIINEREVFSGRMVRDADVIRESLNRHFDVPRAATAIWRWRKNDAAASQQSGVPKED